MLCRVVRISARRGDNAGAVVAVGTVIDGRTGTALAGAAPSRRVDPTASASAELVAVSRRTRGDILAIMASPDGRRAGIEFIALVK